MALNFNDLPNEKPAGGNFPIIEDKYCIATIKSAEAGVSTGANTSGQPVLKIQFDCVSFDGLTQIKIWDNFYESEKPLLRYKLRQFIIALGLHLAGTFELKDIAKIVVNKKLIIAIKTEQNGSYPARNVVDAFDDSIFYPMSELANLKGDDGIAPFDASDSEPVQETAQTASADIGSDNY
jgi:hypothetical protein